MKWGVRRTDAQLGHEPSKKKPKKKKLSLGKKIAVGIGVTSAAAVGGVLVTYLVKKRGTKSVKVVAKTVEAPKKVVEKIISDSPIAQKKVNSFTPTPYSFESLMSQNQQLLDQLLKDT